MDIKEPNTPVGIDFSELFDSEESSISMDRIQTLLDKVMELASAQAKAAPHELVRVIHGGRITWMTRQQAAEFLKQTINTDTREAVDQALHGKLVHIRRELEILLAIARYTLGQYKKQQALHPEDVQRIEPGLKHRERELSEGLAQAGECEILLEQKRRARPLLGQYEDMAAELLEAQAQGNWQRAKELAGELARKKKQYLLASRAIEPETQALNFHRLDLQKTKKKLLGAQSEICSSRRNALQSELGQLQRDLLTLQEQAQHGRLQEMDAAGDGLHCRPQADLNEVRNQLAQRQSQLAALQQEGEVLQFQERQMDSLIQSISEQVGQETPEVESPSKKRPASITNSKLYYPVENSASRKERGPDA
ncbi:MAG: hypothetical protein ACE15F_22745 [bacterium]